MSWKIVVLWLVLVATAVAADGPYAWPLDLPTRYLTSNFLETRGGRFHTGIDLKTEERTGVAVRAVADGWISRIKFAPTGYGKALYLTDATGRTFVYAHLERLADPLRERVRREQADRGRYRVDLMLAPGELPVRRDEVLALSGQTATTGPHLHFEVRDADGSPLNPRRHGFASVDSLPPDILAVRVWWGNRSYCAGDGTVPLHGALPTLRLPAGELGVSARLVERSDPLRYRLEPYRISLGVDGWGVVGAGCNERLRWADVRRERVVFRETELGREQVFWTPRAGGDWTGSGHGPGRPDDPPGTRRTYRLAAEDAAGNRSEVWWDVIVDPEAADVGSPGGRAATAAEVAADQPASILDLGAAVYGEAETAGGGGGSVGILRAPLVAGEVPPFEPLGEPVWYLPEHPFPYEHLVEPCPWCSRRWPASATRRWRSTGIRAGWTYEAAPERRDGRWTFPLDNPGAHLLGRDTTPPVIDGPRRRTVPAADGPRRRHGIGLARWELVPVTLTDGASGIDWDAVTVLLDGVPLVAEPDAPRDRLLIELPDALPPGEHRLTVTACDLAGLTTEATLTVRLTAGPPDGDPATGGE
ncbi:MAG: M23 family metallopeptidase [Candidatus Krumholzibacteriia bacterium]